MREAAMLYGSAPGAMRLRELQTLTEIAREKNMIVVTNTPAAGDITGEDASPTAALARTGEKKESRSVRRGERVPHRRVRSARRSSRPRRPQSEDKGRALPIARSP